MNFLLLCGNAIDVPSERLTCHFMNFVGASRGGIGHLVDRVLYFEIDSIKKQSSAATTKTNKAPYTVASLNRGCRISVEQLQQMLFELWYEYDK
uniref:Uncharacterized protein n=1 Tax=Romanomermis culicivorax TaxID=13658 RepID=A0A915IM27_ROMCU